MRRLLACGLALLAALVPARSQAAPVPVVVIDGKGFGHGVGMAQEGAFWMGAAGASTEQILGQFYPGAAIGRGRGPVRVPVLDAGAAPSSAVVAFPDGGDLRETGSAPSSPGFPVHVEPGGQARVSWDGTHYRVDVANPVAPAAPSSASGRGTGSGVLASTAGSPPRGQVPTLPPPPSSTSTTTTEPQPPPTAPTPTTQPGPTTTTTTTTTTAPPGDTSPPPTEQPGPGGPTAPPPATTTGPTTTRTVAAIPADGGAVAVPDRQHRYRGYVEATAATGTLRLVDTVDVETYLKGMGEVRDPSWPQASLRAQAIAARTYALRAMAIGGELCDTQRCQVYLGADAEYAAMNKAVDASREQVLVFDKALISAVYSANGGGFSASREEGFGIPDSNTDAPYLRAAPYLTKDPGPWSVTVALTDVAGRLHYAGSLTDVRVARAGPSGRAVEVVLDGDAGPQSVPGIAFDAALGLRSTLFTLRVEAGEAPPPPPPAEDVALQAPPEQAAAVAATETAGATTVPPVRAKVAPAPEPHRDRGIPEQLLVVALWFLTAAAAAVVVVSPLGGPLPTRRRSPSAPTSAGDSP